MAEKLKRPAMATADTHRSGTTGAHTVVQIRFEPSPSFLPQIFGEPETLGAVLR